MYDANRGYQLAQVDKWGKLSGAVGRVPDMGCKDPGFESSGGANFEV